MEGLTLCVYMLFSYRVYRVNTRRHTLLFCFFKLFVEFVSQSKFEVGGQIANFCFQCVSGVYFMYLVN